LRINLGVGAVSIDGPLTYASDDRHAGAQPAIVASAYTNSVPKAPSTVLFNIDYQLDVLVRQDPPNDGILTTVGPLGIDCGRSAGFDMVNVRKGVDLALAACQGNLYEVNLRSGAAKWVGKIGAGAAIPDIIGLAIIGQAP
jgi:hypothetical protein